MKKIAKSKLTMFIVKNGKEYPMPFVWRARNLLKKVRESVLRNLGFNVGFADVFTQVGEEVWIDWVDTGTQYVGWGTGAGTHSKSSTTLFTEASETREAATRTQPAADKIRYLATLTANGSKTITNSGVFTALTSGNLIVASDFTGVALNTGEGIKFQWDVELS
jgi:hypothetical protein